MPDDTKFNPFQATLCTRDNVKAKIQHREGHPPADLDGVESNPRQVMRAFAALGNVKTKIQPQIGT
ncbi:LOW QUALITY PROTEIN: hypothetical protein CVT26_012660 [Gymnopilus dilepis]|uniref:Uncharacterized protein n=1 Tax=Gymnopilus dilepis TaxID=231916 RepID=A0A409YQ13_9AGAR|nr:LOW QUALITY PROTEIN: hypothetical protein CVT26_012660 [Gymnopilus dilepis]